MITYEKKLAHMMDVVFGEYSELMDPYAMYVFFRLLWTENRKLKIRGTLEELLKMLELDCEEKYLLEALRVIKECGLINAQKSETGVIVISVNTINKPDFEQKMTILKNMQAKEINPTADYKRIQQRLIEKNEKRKTREASIEVSSEEKKPSNDIDFSKPKAPRKVNPDSAPELVKFYYKLMHEIFGGKYESPNLLKEAHLLKLEMEKHGDSAEDTRKFFAFILNGAKEKGMFDKVSSLSLYSRLRPTAYQRIIVEKNNKYDKFMKYEEVKKTDDDIMTSIREIYDMSIKNGTSVEEIKTQLVEAFSAELVDEFFKGMNND